MSVTDDRTSSPERVPAHLRGNGAPVTEERTLTELTVRGRIPAHLDGRYLRNGPNPLSGWSVHPFLGDGMIHGVRLREGRAEWYRNRYVQTPFMDDPARDIFDTALDPRWSKANTHVVGHAGRIYALEEGHAPYLLDGDLGTVGMTDFGGRLTSAFTAHPKICPETGELLAFGYSALPPYLTYLRVSADGELVQSEPITTGGATMMHDFNITRHHAVFMDLPVVFDLDLAMQGQMPFQWSDEYRPRLGVMPRDGGDADVVWCDVDPCYVFHPMNAYEDGGRIVVDVSRYPHLWRDSTMDFPKPTLWRWTIDPATGTVDEEQCDDLGIEFPRVADSVVGLRHRYGYAVTISGFEDFEAAAEPTVSAGTIVKYDRSTGERTTIDCGPGRSPGEVVFVPAEHPTAEDDGYLMTYVYDAARGGSDFVVIDAATMDPEPVATVELPRIPFGFHGSWVPATVAG